MQMQERDKAEFPDSNEVPTGNPDQRMWVGPLSVQQSAAGYYIGRMCWVEEKSCGLVYQDMYSRESGYYGTKEEAQEELTGMSFEIRDCVENNHAYAEGIIPRPRTNQEGDRRWTTS